MRAIYAQNKAAAGAAAAKRQLDRSIAANASSSSAPANKQRTLAECRGAVSKAECDETLAQLFYASGLPFHLAESSYFQDFLE